MTGPKYWHAISLPLALLLIFSVTLSEQYEYDYGTYEDDDMGPPSRETFDDDYYQKDRDNYDCFRKVKEGDCKDSIERWYYDRRERQCRRFIYSGCGGNGNNFRSRRGCRIYCRRSRKGFFNQLSRFFFFG